MTLEGQVRAEAALPQAKPQAKPRRGSQRARRGCATREQLLLGVGLLLAIVIPLRAEEQARYMDASGRSPLLAHAPVSPAQLSLSPAPNPSLPSLDEPVQIAYGRRVQAIFRSSAQKSSVDDDLVLYRTKVPTRFTYESWAKIETGYGQYLAGEDKIGRWRTSGAGIEDPDWVYLKLSFKF